VCGVMADMRTVGTALEMYRSTTIVTSVRIIRLAIPAYGGVVFDHEAPAYGVGGNGTGPNNAGLLSDHLPEDPFFISILYGRPQAWAQGGIGAPVFSTRPRSGGNITAGAVPAGTRGVIKGKRYSFTVPVRTFYSGLTTRSPNFSTTSNDVE